MFDFSWAEIMLIGIVSMIFIGPKDFPKVVRWGTELIKKARAMAREFHSQVDDIVKDPDLKEAKDQLMQLRHMNVKSVLLNAIDKDGTLQENLTAPLNQTALSPVNPSPDFLDREPPAVNLEYTIPVEDIQEKEPDLELLAHNDPAPWFLPPSIAQRLQVKRAAPPVPAMIPPQVAAYKDERWS